MADSLAKLLQSVVSDAWRREVRFSPDVSETSARMLDAGTDEARAAALGEWLERSQPCLFGRIAAQRSLLSYCFLTTADVERGDDFVRTKIQAARTEWSARAYDGERSGFVIALLSPDLERAQPNETVSTIARRLCGLYLLMDADDIELDRIYLDNVRLEAQLPNRPTWEWDVGVNYFSAQGDRRWWHDHRIPAGMALSMNSVGHMVKATIQTQAAKALEKRLDVEPGDNADSTVDSLGKALKLAMMTIDRAAEAVSGRATWLLPDPGPGSLPRCPIDLPANLADKNHCEYAGFYHTDATLPSLYFRADVNRPDEATVRQLDFTYLNEAAADRIDRIRVGAGRRIRESGAESGPLGYSKWGKAHPRTIER